MESLENFKPIKESESKVEIKPIGSFLETDEDGFLVNPASMEKIQPEYGVVIESVVDLYKQRFGESLKNVYIRDSVAKGQAIEDVSDIDATAFVDLSEEEMNQREQVGDKELLEKYPFITETELVARPIANSNNQVNVIFLNQAICVYGEPIETHKIKPGKDTIVHLYDMDGIVSRAQNFFESDRSEERVKSKCAGLMKRLVRSGCELVMERSGKYTRDLYPSYEIFAEYYPEKSEEMLEALDLALNPTADKEKIQSIVNKLGNWLADEYRKNYEESEGK